jgi:hypothetical protein
VSTSLRCIRMLCTCLAAACVSCITRQLRHSSSRQISPRHMHASWLSRSGLGADCAPELYC